MEERQESGRFLAAVEVYKAEFDRKRDELVTKDLAAGLCAQCRRFPSEHNRGWIICPKFQPEQ